MNTRRVHVLFLLLLAIFFAAFFRSLGSALLGHDYFTFFPKLLDGLWHFRRQGIFPFMFTPHFCGGFVQYGNPQAMFYSLQQLLSGFLDVWTAVRLTILTSMFIGYIGWYRFGREIIRLRMHWAHVFALIIIAHGFYIMHMVAGHVPFHSMPLIGWLLLFILRRENVSLRECVSIAAFSALLTAYIFYSGGYMVFVMILFALVAFLPFELLLHVGELRMRCMLLIKRALACGIGALLTGASKLVAVVSFLRFFPREMPFERFTEGSSALWYTVKAFFALPQTDDLFASVGMPNWGAVHEYSLFLSPVVLASLFFGIILLWKRRRAVCSRPVLSLTFFFIALFQLVFFLQLAQGYGWMVTPLENLPIFTSLHMNTRYLYAYSFLLVAVAVWCVQEWTERSRWKHHGLFVAFSFGALTVAAWVLAYAGLFAGETLPRTMPYPFLHEALEEHPGFLSLPVETMYLFEGLGHSEFVPFLFGGNDRNCHEPMLWGGGNPELDDLVPGPVAIVWDERFNMFNPACMQYPEENDCRPGDRIHVSDAENWERFRMGEKTTWKVSLLQHIGNWVSIFTFIAALLWIAGMYFMQKRAPSA
ncbi:hypothetical protein A2880_00860 [Candidatus Peribacteria bacterium RIFCSPHIGHO2_01_FULL_49_38]|nr:MAG: hypothetical protein A2880_00860 [Candidatus Peribacteria bacterium RIFCSPHIGHO2_01_FULL_49_38]